MSITVTVTDISCDGCEEIVENAVSEVSGVESVDADQEEKLVTVEGEADVDAITEAIDFAGYTPGEASVGDDEPEAGDEDEDQADNDEDEGAEHDEPEADDD